MANPEHLAILKEGVETWNRWRETETEIKPDLSLADLSQLKLSGADFRRSNLKKANLTQTHLADADLEDAVVEGAKFISADLRDANLQRTEAATADFSHANLWDALLFETVLWKADLTGADLSEADLITTHLEDAILQGADLTRAMVWGASFRDARLSGANFNCTDCWENNYARADFAGATLDGTKFSNENFCEAHGLNKVNHASRSFMDTLTLQRTARGLREHPQQRESVEQFFRAAGIAEPFMELFPSLIASPIEFYSCFISYSHDDKMFARRLYDTLQGRGIRCWLDEHQVLPGDDIRDRIDRGIKIWDKTLLCCSRDALEKSWWVEQEIDKAQDKEAEIRKTGEKALALVPLDLDGFVHEWDNGRASMLKSRKIADFVGWKSDSDKFDASLEKVIAALRTDERGRPEEPEPKLGK